MDVRQLADGLWIWTAPHPDAARWPDWGPKVPPEVGCVYYEAPDAVVLIDPLLPAGEEEKFLAHLDRDVERRGLPVSILLTAAWHARSAAILRERYGADDRVPASVETYPIEGAPEEQLAYFIRPHRALVVAEILAGDGSGGLVLVPSPALTDPAALDRSLRAIAELPVELVLVSHGEPVLEDGRAAIELALRERAFL
jgi:glyoxylase-like metal-dependent hydrolase (beta-lactamase superfamily II)